PRPAPPRTDDGAAEDEGRRRRPQGCGKFRSGLRRPDGRAHVRRPEGGRAVRRRPGRGNVPLDAERRVRPGDRQYGWHRPGRSGHRTDSRATGRTEVMSSKGIVGELVVVTTRLVELMGREADLLKQGRILGVAALQTEKGQLVDSYA